MFYAKCSEQTKLKRFISYFHIVDSDRNDIFASIKYMVTGFQIEQKDLH